MTNTLQSVCPWVTDVKYHVSTQPLSTFIQLNPDHRALDFYFKQSQPSFYWQTVDLPGSCPHELYLTTTTTTASDMQTTMSLIYRQVTTVTLFLLISQ